MGKLTNGINGPVSGKVGKVVGSNRNGVPYLKGPSKKRTKKVSEKEKANRVRFTAAQSWLSPVLDYVRQGFEAYTITCYGFIAAKSYLLLNATEQVNSDFLIHPELVKVSFGTLPLSNNIAVKKVDADKLEFTWDTAPVEGGSAYDQVALLAYDIKKGKAYHSLTGQFRTTGMDRLNIGTKARRTLHIYISFIAADRSKQSDSIYLGTITT